MSPRIARRPVRRWLAPALLALSIAAQSSVAAVTFVPRAADGAAPPQSPSAPRVADTSRELAVTARTSRAEPRAAVPAAASKPTTVKSTAKPTAAKPKPAVAKPVSKPKPASPATSYHGRNHVWIPALGVNRSVTGFSCSRSTPPGNFVYRWGCAGRNNVYLFGHAYSVFKSLHDAYVRGRLYKGMKVIYADGAGRVRTYKVSFWRVVSPVGAEWAFASQSRPSLTLQTCVGAQSQWRLIVRLVAA
jgi:sortase (surface protein transpeptidase)